MMSALSFLPELGKFVFDVRAHELQTTEEVEELESTDDAKYGPPPTGGRKPNRSPLCANQQWR